MTRRADAPLWTWIVPLVAATAVFTGVLLSTPPGFAALTDVLFGQPRGPNAEGAAYALGAAGALALVALLALAAGCWLVERLVTRR
jgi:hypothetical protein